jgi:class 3 adenylate cyclase
MRVRRLFERTRPFRYAGLWSMATIALLSIRGEADAPGAWQLGIGAAVCLAWPVLVDVWRRRWPPPSGAEPLARYDCVAYTVECAALALLVAWMAVPPLAALAALLCLLAGALALAGPGLLGAALAAVALGAGAGLALAPTWRIVGVSAADAVAAGLLFGFGIGLAHLAFRQTRRLDAHRLALARRSAELERLTGRMERYLPPSLRTRLAAAPEAACAWERRWLTVAFVDLAGFTELADRLEAEPLARLLDDYLAALVAAAERHGGEVSKLMGDGVLVAFGGRGDAGRRDRADAALAFCAAVPALLGSLAGRWRERGELVTLAMRAGIASGYCTLGDRGGAGRLDFTLVGSPVNLASRLQSMAMADGVLVDAATAALTTDRQALGQGQALEVKGLGPQLVYPVAADRVDQPCPSAIVPAPFAHR